MGEVLNLLPGLQDALSLLEKVMRETQVCEHRENPVERKGKRGGRAGIFEEVTDELLEGVI